MKKDEISRRVVLATTASTVVAFGVGASSVTAVSRLSSDQSNGAVGTLTVPFFGEYQPGISTPPQAKAAFLGFKLRPNTDGGAIGRLLRLWTNDISLLMSGKPTMGDANPELAATPAGLTVTVGLGFEPFNRVGKPYEFPVIAREIPPYKIDALVSAWTGGDLFLQVCAEDSLIVAHAVRELIKDAAPFASVSWMHQGFTSHAGVNEGATPRNLMGQVDGTRNPRPDAAEFSRVVWNDGERHPWFKNGTTLAFRKIRMELRTWEQLDPLDQEKVIGRNRRNGAPLTGVAERDLPDLIAKNPNGSFVIPDDAHIRRASSATTLLRRAYNYDDGYNTEGKHDVGLLFASYQAELDAFLEIQSRLAENDALNAWTTPVGSAVFAILPGVERGDYLGSAIFA
jgi:dye decolorizing peroxidase